MSCYNILSCSRSARKKIDRLLSVSDHVVWACVVSLRKQPPSFPASRGLSRRGREPPSFCEFNFGGKEQRYKIEGLDPNKGSISYKLKYRTKEAMLILQSGGATIGTWFPRDGGRPRNELRQRGNSILMNVTTQIWVILLTGPTVWKICSKQSEARPRSGKWQVISVEFLRLFLRRLCHWNAWTKKAQRTPYRGKENRKMFAIPQKVSGGILAAPVGSSQEAGE